MEKKHIACSHRVQYLLKYCLIHPYDLNSDFRFQISDFKKVLNQKS